MQSDMQSDQRCDEKRIEIARPVEILDPSIGLGVSGYTKDLSVSGLRARFDVAPTTGDMVQLQITLADGTSPLETQGEVIWCDRDIRGGGAEVGLRFVAPKEEEALQLSVRKTEINPEMQDQLVLGQQVAININGQSVQAVVEKVAIDETVSPQSFLIGLRIPSGVAPKTPNPDAKTAAAKEDQEITDNAEDWKPHPFKDMWVWMQKYLGPVIAVFVTIAIALGRVLVRLWGLIPKKPRRKVEAFFRRLEPGYAVVKRAFTALSATIGSKT